ncbi:MAG: PadR family transcriptional regulator [Acutalibacteraceae bacterium]|nr:PadR family transcriptional regulator [Acutalibacteraceae bacterium]
MAISDNVKRGSIEVVILTLLQERDMYGYELSREIQKRSNGRYSLLESSMYPTLYRLVNKGFISDRQEKIGKRRIRVYYHLETQGADYLCVARKEWLSLTAGVLNILERKNAEDICDE